VQLAFAGNPEQVKCKAVIVAAIGVIVMWTVAGWPALNRDRGQGGGQL
jgi:hypothetical protein